MIERVAVVGLWHLGSVIAACLAAADYEVIALDPDPALIGELSARRPAVAEPGLAELIADQLAAGRLRFAGTGDPATAHAAVVWIAFDSPVDEDDVADDGWVLDQAAAALAAAREDALVIVSAQLPVGSVGRLCERMSELGHGRLRYACIPENLRLGRAIETFRAPERFVVGTRTAADLAQVTELLSPFGAEIIAMGVESAEMTKHALNGFLATSVAYINEIATICELVGADAEEVSRGLRSDLRIGPRAYLGPGDAFAGGTLARDIRFLQEIARERGFTAALTAGVAASNASHRTWARGALTTALGLGGNGDEPALEGRRIAVWGLTYKPGTSTLRRSSALELCDWLERHGAEVHTHDPTVTVAPPGHRLTVAPSPEAALEDAEALVVCTAWPQYRDVPAERALAAMRAPVVIDAAGHVHDTLGSDPRVRYTRVGVAA